MITLLKILPIKCLLFLISSLIIFSSKAAIINGPADVCIGNLAYFKSLNNTGVNTYRWEFGDGFTSGGKAPFHLYKNPGKYLLKLTLSMNNGSTVNDSMLVMVHNLPKAILKVLPGSDSCLFTNEFKFKDESTPSDPNNKVTKRLMVWGDGDFQLENNRQFGDEFKHHYELKDEYKVKMEITDNKGCKSSEILKVKVVDGTLAKIKHEINYPSCGEAEVCFSNDSKTSNGGSQTYLWNFDGTGYQSLDKNNITCFKTSRSKFVTAELILSNPDNTCMTRDTVKIYLNADSLTNTVTLSDSVICYGSGVGFTIDNSAGNSCEYAWKLNGKDLDFTNYQINSLPKSLGMGPGIHTFEWTISKGSCSKSYTAKFRVKGPVARMKIFNKEQCQIDKRVYFIDTSININKKHALYFWELTDPEGENCTNHRILDKNKYKNCNFSLDWYGKHDYTVPRSMNRIELTVHDTLVGCSDKAVDYVEHLHCKVCDRGKVSICQGDTFLKLKKNEIAPILFSLDTGKSWLKFPSQINKPYKGLYGVSFIFKSQFEEWAEDFGDDSIKVHRYDTTWYDTIFVSDFLYVKETMDTMLTLKVENVCNPFVAELGFVNPKFQTGDRIIIHWKDGKTDDILFSKDSILPFVRHTYELPGLLDSLEIYFYSNEGCYRYRYMKIMFGKSILMNSNGNPCWNETNCFNIKTVNFNQDSKYNAFKKISWYSRYLQQGLDLEEYCQKLIDTGKLTITAITIDSLDCVDTTELEIKVRKLKAGIVDDARISFCSELKQMFDSSYHICKAPGDYIKQYRWDFGSGMYTTDEKDPFRSFDLRDSIVKVSHYVIDNNGCIDSINFDILVIGSIPEFTFTDTIGCSPLKVNFKNTSRKCSSYIWEFDDPDNSTIEDREKLDHDFIYKKPGIYFPKLIGIDTFYNPYTGSVYYCHETFDPKKSITVFETKFAKLTCADTICLGQKLEFLCDANTPTVYWNYGNGDKTNKFYIQRPSYQYTGAGTYDIEYKPVWNFGNGTIFCKDSFSKTIVVLDVNADFDIDSDSKAPIFKFLNRSFPSYADLKWDFGDPSSGSDNTSTAQNPFHNYGRSNGNFMVCLTASVFNKCKDSICKPIVNDYKEFIRLYNVFTPGISDNKNDEYEVSIEGESFYKLSIYDRWGVKVYEGNEDAEIGDGNNWNGKVFNTGNECSSGTYYYIFTYSYLIAPDTKYTVEGTITLMR